MCVIADEGGISSYSLGLPPFAWGVAETLSARVDEITLIPTWRNMMGINHYIPVTCFLLISPCVMISLTESERENKWKKILKTCMHTLHAQVAVPGNCTRLHELIVWLTGYFRVRVDASILKTLIHTSEHL